MQKMHLVLTPVVFAARHLSFARILAKIHRIYGENRKFRASKDLRRLFFGGAEPVTQPHTFIMITS